MKITWNQHVVKRNNKSLIFQTIMEDAPLSRADLAAQIGLNKSTVSSLVSDLIDGEFVYETGPGESSGGRRPVMLLFNEQAGFSIGIDIGVNYIYGVLTDLRGTIVTEKNVMIQNQDYPIVLHQVIDIIHFFINSAPSSPYGVIGIGIGIPGIVDKSGEILLAPNLGWENVMLKDDIVNHFNLPVMIENEANAGGIGEFRYGAGQNCHHLLYVSAGIGIGVGVLMNGQLNQGAKGYSGEAGHMMIDINGKKCSCGRFGCWEAYASEHALMKLATNEYQDKAITFEKLLTLAEQNEPFVMKQLEQVGYYLGIGIANLINIYNPEHIVIGNRLSLAEKWIHSSVMKGIKQHSLPFHQEDIKITFSELSTSSTARGVATFAIEYFLKQENLVDQL